MYKTFKEFRLFDIKLFKLKIKIHDDSIDNKKNVTKIEDKELLNTNNKKIIKIAIINGGGMGDSIIDVAFLQNLKTVLPKESQIDYYAKSALMFRAHPALNHVYNDTREIEKNSQSYDVILGNHRFFMIKKLDKDKVKQLCPLLYEFCNYHHDLRTRIMRNHNDNNALFRIYADLLGKNRWEQLDPLSITGFDRHCSLFMPIHEEACQILERLSLKKKTYITINRGVDRNLPENCPKLWPLRHYKEFVAKIKKLHPDITIVQIGTDEKYGVMGADLCLCGKTSIEESAVLMKYALLHIDGEGGLVHLNHVMHGTSVVIIGPTPLNSLKYEENIYLKNSSCPDVCDWVIEDWQKGCLRGYSEPPCMTDTTPDDVINTIETFLIKRKVPCLIQCMNNYNSGYNICAFVGFKSISAIPETLMIGKKHVFFSENYLTVDSWECRLGIEYNLDASNDEFDIVFLLLSKNNIMNEFIIDECTRVLKNKGKVILSYSQNFEDSRIYEKRFEGWTDRFQSQAAQFTGCRRSRVLAGEGPS